MGKDIKRDIKSVFITNEQLKKRISELADEINREFAGKKLIVICILRGSIMFYADLFRLLNMDARMAFMDVCYVNGQQAKGVMRLRYDLDVDIERENVLVVEDIIDTGNTMKYVVGLLKLKNPKKLKVCTLLNRMSKRIHPFKPDYIGFEIEDEFVVGYGLDFSELYRNINAVGILKEEVYKKPE